MSFESNIKNYNLFNKVELNANNELESVILSNEIKERLNEADYFNDERVMLNTLSFADLFTTSKINKSINYPEVAMMFIKTYMYKIFKDKSTIAIRPDLLYKIMNNNQELIELPYVMVLYLGALYHYKIYDSMDKINTQSINTVFNRTNKVALANLDKTDPKNNESRDIYQTQELFRSPSRIKITHDDPTVAFSKKVYFPSVRVLNRSVLTGSTIYNTNNIEFRFVSSKDSAGQEIISNTSIDSINIMPSVGYGIQNNFLNYYNEFVFGDYMNGSVSLDANENVYNNGLPHVLIGGYCGISKPIKTYDSGLLEFTALYRNAWVGEFSINDVGYRVDDLVTAFNDSLQNFKTTNNYDANKQSLIRSFIVLSKIKALVLSNQITTENSLYTYILKLCQRKTIGPGPDLYYLIKDYFFAKENEIDEKLIKPSTIAENESDSTSIIARYITQYLLGLWGREKFNLQPKFNSINSKVVYGLYPSAGGFISPHALFNDPTKKTKLNLATDNGISVGTQTNLFTAELIPNNNFYRPIFNKLYYFTEKRINEYSKVDGVDMYSIKSSELYNLIKPNEITTEQTNQKKPKYFFEKDFNNDAFLRDYCFNNHSILKNTSRMLWFDTTNNGELLKCDLSTGTTINFFEELVSGIDYTINDRTYFTHNHFINYDYQNHGNRFKGTGVTWGEQFTLAHLMDSLDFEKLEEFRQLFLNFATPDATLPGNEGFNVKTLMLASTLIGYDDIESYTDDLTAITLSADDINVALIGNSMYNYDFIAKSGLNKFMNGALTKAQKKKVTQTISSFCSQTTTIANFSPMGSIKYGTAPELAAHLFPFSPDLIFSDVKNYDELAVKLKQLPKYNITEKDITRYLSRKILFGDVYVAPYNEGNTKTKFDDYNKLYLINKIYTEKTEATKNEPGKSVDVLELYREIVNNYFKELNIEFNPDIYKQQIKMIRSYVFDTLKQLKLINEELMPDKNFIGYDEFNTYFNIIPPPEVQAFVGSLATPSGELPIK